MMIVVNGLFKKGKLWSIVSKLLTYRLIEPLLMSFWARAQGNLCYTIYFK